MSAKRARTCSGPAALDVLVQWMTARTWCALSFDWSDQDRLEWVCLVQEMTPLVGIPEIRTRVEYWTWSIRCSQLDWWSSFDRYCWTKRENVRLRQIGSRRSCHAELPPASRRPPPAMSVKRARTCSGPAALDVLACWLTDHPVPVAPPIREEWETQQDWLRLVKRMRPLVRAPELRSQIDAWLANCQASLHEWTVHRSRLADEFYAWDVEHGHIPRPFWWPDGESLSFEEMYQSNQAQARLWGM